MSPHPSESARVIAGLTVNDSTCTVHRHGIAVRLTRMEFHMFELLLAEPTVTLREVAKLTRRVDGVSNATVRGYVAKLRRKLKPLGLEIVADRGRGYVLRAR